MVNNHHIEEYGPLRWEYISGGSEICWIPVIIIRTLCVQITAKSKFMFSVMYKVILQS